MSQTAKREKRIPHKTKRADYRISEEDKNKVTRAAKLSGTSFAAFSITAAREAADRVLQEHEVMRLTAADREVVVNALMNPRPLNDNLRAAANRHTELFGS